MLVLLSLPAWAGEKVEAELIDGSRIRGTLQQATLDIHTAYMKAEIAVREVRSIHVKDGKHWIQLRAGDRLGGRIQAAALDLATVVGPVKIPIDRLKSLVLESDIPAVTHWETTYGRMTLKRQGNQVNGTYGNGAGNTITGRMQGNSLTFEYREGNVRGEGIFEFGEDGFTGKWRPEGRGTWSEWNGKRVTGHPPGGQGPEPEEEVVF